MDDVCFSCTRPRASVRNEQKCLECLLLNFFFWCIMQCTIAAKCKFAQIQITNEYLLQQQHSVGEWL
jgi:hypothetical protein